MKWISVEETFPAIRELVLLADGHKICLGLRGEPNMFLGINYYIKSPIQACNVYLFKPLHWMKIPEMPNRIDNA